MSLELLDAMRREKTYLYEDIPVHRNSNTPLVNKSGEPRSVTFILRVEQIEMEAFEPSLIHFSVRRKDMQIDVVNQIHVQRDPELSLGDPLYAFDTPYYCTPSKYGLALRQSLHYKVLGYNSGNLFYDPKKQKYTPNLTPSIAYSSLYYIPSLIDWIYENVREYEITVRTLALGPYERYRP